MDFGAKSTFQIFIVKETAFEIVKCVSQKTSAASSMRTFFISPAEMDDEWQKKGNTEKRFDRSVFELTDTTENIFLRNLFFNKMI